MIEFRTTDDLPSDLQLPDVYYSPVYGASAAYVDGGTWECAVDESLGCFMPYLRRPVPGREDVYDIVTPYGYSAVAGPPPAVSQFRRRFLDSSRERGLVSEFIRTNPFEVRDAEDVKALQASSSRSHTTYLVTWQEDPEEYFAAAEGRHRTAARRAVREGVQVNAIPAADIVDASSPFRVLYAETMVRVGASARLRLEDGYFAELTALGQDHVDVLEARSGDGTVLAAAIFLRWGDRVHYHLSGSTESGQRIGATNLLLDHAARHLLSPGAALHLGGGVAPGDGLDRFKRSIATRPTEIHLCRTVVNAELFEELTAAAGRPQTEFFPPYRAPRST